jgi:hypothetical protein
MLQTVYNQAVKSMVAVAVADAEEAYLRSIEKRKMTQMTFGINVGRKLSLAIIKDQERYALRKRSARLIDLHGFDPAEPIAHAVEFIIVAVSFIYF